MEEGHISGEYIVDVDHNVGRIKRSKESDNATDGVVMSLTPRS